MPQADPTRQNPDRPAATAVDAQRSEVHEVTDDASVSPASAVNDPKADKIPPDYEKTVLESDLKPTKTDTDAGGPLIIDSSNPTKVD